MMIIILYLKSLPFQLVQHALGPYVFSFLFKLVPNDEEASFFSNFVKSLDRSASGSLFLRYDYRNFLFSIFGLTLWWIP